jgi:hypothetical protein
MPARLLVSILSLGLLVAAVRAFPAAGDLDAPFDTDGKLATKVSTTTSALTRFP